MLLALLLTSFEHSIIQLELKHANYGCRQFVIFCNVPLLAGIGRVCCGMGLYKAITY